MDRTHLLPAILLSIFLASPALAQTGGSLSDLTKPQEGRSMRETSTMRVGEVRRGDAARKIDPTADPKGDLEEASNFDNFRVAIEDVIGEGDRVVVRFREMGRHQGQFEGIAPTGKEVMWTEMAIFRLAEGRIAEGWTVEDRLSLMQQMGAIPPPSQD